MSQGIVHVSFSFSVTVSGVYSYHLSASTSFFSGGLCNNYQEGGLKN